MPDVNSVLSSAAGSAWAPPSPLLSLCLPTYKRASLLQQSLNAVLSQISPEVVPEVEVLVLDNASPDDTPRVVENAKQQFSGVPLRYIRHKTNIGMDNNFLQSALLAHGKFVLLISDDDILLPGAVAKLLELIHQHPDFDGFLLNIRSFATDPHKIGPNWLKLSEDITLSDRDSVLHLIRGHITYMSIVAFNRSRISDRLAAGQYKDKVGTYFLECYLFLDALASGGGVVAIAEPLIAQRVENAHRLNFFQVFVTEFHALMDYAEAAGFSHQAIVQSRNENLIEVRHFLSRIFIYNRRTELWSSRRDGIIRLFRAFGFRPYLWFAVIPLMFFPRPLRPLVYTIRRLLGRPAIEVGKEASAQS